MTTETQRRVLNTCPKCEWQWFSRVGTVVKLCPHCKRHIPVSGKAIPKAKPSGPKQHACLRCGHTWNSRRGSPPIPRICPRCRSSLWNRERKPRGLGSVAQQAIRLRKDNPCLTSSDIGRELGVTRERIRQILARDALPTRRLHQEYVCQQCGTTIQQPRRFCSLKCRFEYNHPVIECDQCGKLFRRDTSKILASARNPLSFGRFFCNRHCLGKYRGLHSGFAAHPEFTRRPRQRKYDYDAIWQKHIETGYGAVRLARLLHIPEPSTYAILRTYAREHNITLATRPYVRHVRNMPVVHQPPIARSHIRVRWLAHLNFSEREIREMTHCSASTYWRAIYGERSKNADSQRTSGRAE